MPLWLLVICYSSTGTFVYIYTLPNEPQPPPTLPLTPDLQEITKVGCSALILTPRALISGSIIRLDSLSLVQGASGQVLSACALWVLSKPRRTKPVPRARSQTDVPHLLWPSVTYILVKCCTRMDQHESSYIYGIYMGNATFHTFHSSCPLLYKLFTILHLCSATHCNFNTQTI